MAYNFSISSGKLIVTLDTESGKFSENIHEYLQPNLVLGNDRVFLKEDGLFVQDFVFEAFGDINGSTAENLVDAYNLLDSLIKGIFVVAVGGDFIPLSGTTVGNPVTGNIEISEYKGLVRINETEEKTSFIGFEDGNSTIRTLDTGLGYVSQIQIVGNGIEILNQNPSSRGLGSYDDYTSNITDLDYTQKKYVDQKVADSRPYKVYTALLTQTGANAPTATVLENTLGQTVTWIRTGVGSYTISDLINNGGKILYVVIGNNWNSSYDEVIYRLNVGIQNVALYSIDLLQVRNDDDILENTPIEIRIYN